MDGKGRGEWGSMAVETNRRLSELTFGALGRCRNI
jgi:hypothetical protein